MYNVDLKNIVPSGDLTCLFAKATIDESNLWHRRLGHISFKTINTLVKRNLVRGLLEKVFENDNSCVACKKGKQHRASCKSKPVSSIDQPLFRLHMDLFGPTFVNSLSKKSYCLVITDDYSRFTWVFFLATKDETTPILKTFITGLENQLSLKVKTEAVNTACYVQNRVLVTKPHNKTPYEILHGKFQGKVDEGFLVGYSVCSKAFRVFNSRTRIVQETLLVNFLENKPSVAGTGPTWLFDIDSLSGTMNYHPVSVENQPLSSAGFQDPFDAEKAGEDVTQTYMFFPAWSAGSTNPQNNDKNALVDGKEHGVDIQKSVSADIHSLSSSAQIRNQADKTECENIGKSAIESFTGYRDLNAEFEGCTENSDNGVNAATVSPTYGKSSSTSAFTSSHDTDMPALEELTYSDDEAAVGAEADVNNLEPSIPRAIGTKWVYRNKKDERGIVIKNKARLVAQGHTQEEGINYKEVFASVARIKAIRLFLAYASFMGFLVYQMDVKSAFIYCTIEEEVYVCQPPRFEDLGHPDKVYKVVKALYGLHQAPRAWYETLATYLLENGFQRGTIDQTLFIKKQKGDILLVQIYVKQKKDGIFISQDKYIAEILRKFGLNEGKSASTPIDTEKPLLKDLDGEDCKKQTVVATSSTEAKYVATASGCAQVL
nr:hypothetical protein [Tanacetum cinerariifolium]